MNDNQPQFHVATLMELPIPSRQVFFMTLLSSQPVPPRRESVSIAGATPRRESANLEAIISCELSLASLVMFSVQYLYIQLIVAFTGGLVD